MITTLTNGDREHSTELFDQIFKSRSVVFYERLHWNVSVQDGWETDATMTKILSIFYR